jgi:hypothetical protein
MMLLYVCSQFEPWKELISSHVANMRLVYGTLEQRSDSFVICTRAGVWPRGIKSKKLRKWLESRRQVLPGYIYHSANE